MYCIAPELYVAQRNARIVLLSITFGDSSTVGLRLIGVTYEPGTRLVASTAGNLLFVMRHGAGVLPCVDVVR